jgi:hypothetical protein
LCILLVSCYELKWKPSVFDMKNFCRWVQYLFVIFQHTAKPILKFTTHKGLHLDTVERYHIYQTTEQGMPINDTSTITKNKIFDVIVKHDSQ